MSEDQLIAELKRGYVCPAEAGPAWLEAYRAGVDMALIEENLRRTPWERLLANDRALALLRALDDARVANDGTTH